jgi:hypothetical protein
MKKVPLAWKNRACPGSHSLPAPRAVHDPGKVIAELAAAVALGGDCLADIAALRGQRRAPGTPAATPPPTRGAKDTGLRNLPLWGFAQNQP